MTNDVVAPLMLIAIICVSMVAAQAFTNTPWTGETYGERAIMTSTSQDPNVFTRLSVEAAFVTDTMFRLRIFPKPGSPGPAEAPYVVPDVVIPNNTLPSSAYRAADHNAFMYTPATSTSGSLFFYENNRVDDVVLALNNIQFSRQLVSFTTPYIASTDYIYGYGEHDYYYFLNHDKQNANLSLWNTDNGTPWETPMYGVHPVVFVSNPTMGRHFAIMWANSHAQSLQLQGGQMTFTAVGGIIDLYVIMDETPLGVLRQYHAIIGPSAVPPYWSLGTHQCRWGYENLTVVQAVVAGYEAAGIPLETMWNDIDYMDRFRVFTTDPQRYPQQELQAFIEALHNKSMHYVQITDPGVAYAANYSVYTSGLAAGAFVRTSQTGEPLVNAVWPGWTVFPDFTSPNASAWWGEQIAAYRAGVPIDGMWLDMNELGTFCAGQCAVTFGTTFNVNWAQLDWSTFAETYCYPNNCTVTNSPLNFPPVNPLTNGNGLYNKTLDMTGVLSLGSYYQTKAFYGMMEERATYEALLNQTQLRPFLLSRASYMGSGRYTAHWTGDNSATWTPQKGGIGDSIQAVLGANLWGIPMVGADIGGFGGNSTTEELLVRWYQLGAFYPFTRNHRDNQGPGQEPYRFSEQAQAAIKAAIEGKYRLLPYLFTYLMGAHANAGPVLRHLSLQFPSDVRTYEESSQFMFGDAIMVAPVVEEGIHGLIIYLPVNQTWYHLWTGVCYSNTVLAQVANLPFFVFDSVYDPIPTFARGGSVIPVHETPAMTVTATQASGIGLRVYMDVDNTAFGEVQIATDAPLESQTVTVNKFFAAAVLTSGSIRTAGNAPATNAALASRVTVYVFFPTCVDMTGVSSLNFTVNGVSDTDPIASVNCSALSYQLPLGVDGSTSFTLEWSIAVDQPTVTGGSNKAAIIGGSIAGGLALVIGAGVAYHFDRKRRMLEEGGEFIPLA